MHSLCLLVGTPNEAHMPSFSFPSSDSHHVFSPSTFTAQPTNRNSPSTSISREDLSPIHELPKCTICAASHNADHDTCQCSFKLSHHLCLNLIRAVCECWHPKYLKTPLTLQPRNQTLDSNPTSQKLFEWSIHQQLFQKAHLKESDEPLDVEPRVYTEWRKSVSKTWKPVSHFSPFFPTNVNLFFFCTVEVNSRDILYLSLKSQEPDINSETQSLFVNIRQLRLVQGAPFCIQLCFLTLLSEIFSVVKQNNRFHWL